MSSQDPSHSPSHGKSSTQKDILENDNFTLATKNANISIDNAVQLKDTPSQKGSVFERHVFCLSIAYNEVDVLSKSVDVSQQVTIHAKSLYTQLYNYSDFDEHEFQHDTLIAACVYIACCKKNQPRSMPEVFKSTRATNQHMLTVYKTVKGFLAVPPETRALLSKADKRIQFACREIGTLSELNSIPQHASDHAIYLYKQIHDSESFKDHDHRRIIASCLLVACRQLNVPQSFPGIFAMDPGITKNEVAILLESLEVVFAAETKQKIKKMSQNQGAVASTNAEAYSTNRVLHTLQQMIEHLDLEAKGPTINRVNAGTRASFQFTAPTSAPITTSDDEDTKIGTSTAPTAPFAANMAYAFHDSFHNNIISTIPPTKPGTTVGHKNARAVRNTLYNVICCQCKKILNLQNIHYNFQCVNCKHKQCDSCAM